MTSLEWNYNGIYPNGAESTGLFWGWRGIKSYSGNPFPAGTLSGETAVTTPTNNVITCTAVNTIGYSWQKSTDGSTWTDIADEHGKTLSSVYPLGSHGTYQYRCLCYGWLGTTTTEPLAVTVSEPSISTYLTASETEIAYGASTLITCFITPYPLYAKSFKWQTSTDGETWTDIAESTREHTFTGTTPGSHYFRVIATQYDDVTVTSNALEITVAYPSITVSLSASPTSIVVGGTSTLTGSVTYSEYVGSYEWYEYLNGAWQLRADMTHLSESFTPTVSEYGTVKFKLRAVRMDEEYFESDEVTITVGAPAITVSLTASETEIAVGETSTLTGSISPSQSYAKSFRWEQSADGTEWTTLAESTLEHTFTGETAGTTYFRFIGVKLDDTEVTSASVSITVTEEE